MIYVEVVIIKAICIYAIFNQEDGKVYIGQTIDYHRRKLAHISSMERGNHHNEHLQCAWRKHGKDAFVFKVIERCSEQQLEALEKKYIALYQSTNPAFGYNLVDGGQVFRSYTPRLKKKISRALRGRVFTEEHKKRISLAQRGKIIKPESIERARETAKRNGKNRGERNPNSSISDKTAELIIKELWALKPVKEIAEAYQVSPNLVYMLMYNKSRPEILPHLREALTKRTALIKNNKYKQAIDLYLSGVSQNQIAAEMHMSRNTLRRILKENGINTKLHINQYINHVNTEVTS